MNPLVTEKKSDRWQSRLRQGIRTAALAALSILAGLESARASTEDDLWDDGFGNPGLVGFTDVVGSFVPYQGKTLVSGLFESIGGAATTNVALWSHGKWEPLLIPGAGAGIFSDFTPYKQGFLALGFFYTQADPNPGSALGYWDGNEWHNLSGTLTSRLRARRVANYVVCNDEVYVAGWFDSISGVPAQNIARWDGQKWNSLGEGIELRQANGHLQEVRQLLALNGAIYAAGSFSYAGGKRVYNIARWDRTNWFALGEGVKHSLTDPLVTELGMVRAIAEYQRGLVATGEFSLAGDKPALGIAHWDGESWNAIGDGFPPGTVEALAASDSLLFAGGTFSTAAIPKLPASYLAKWDGVRWSSIGHGLDGSVSKLGTDMDHLFVAGGFGLAGGKPSSSVALWHLPIALKSDVSPEGLSISWPANRGYIALERSSGLGGSAWEAVALPTEVQGDRRVVRLPFSDTRAFYRLRQN